MVIPAPGDMAPAADLEGMGNTLTPLIHRYLAGRYRRGELTSGTARARRYELGTLARSFGRRPLAALGPAAIDRWLESVRDHAPSTRRSYLSSARMFCRWMVADGMVAKDPTAHVPPIRQPRQVPVTLTPDAVALVLSDADTRLRLVLWLMVGCGCRCIEVARLRVEDYDPRERTILLTGKGGHERELPVPAEVALALDQYLDERGRVAGHLVQSRRPGGGPVQADTISKWVSKAMAAAGVKARVRDGKSAHGLRRTAGSDVMDRCGDIRVVQQMLGHLEVQTTARYYLRPASAEKLRDAMAGREYRLAA